MNAVKMIHTIARYYNTTDRMTHLFSKITNQMILNCKECILEGDEPDQLWEKDPLALIKHLESCIKLNQKYQEQYHATKEPRSHPRADMCCVSGVRSWGRLFPATIPSMGVAADKQSRKSREGRW